MAYALRQSIRNLEPARSSSTCRVHTCVRCHCRVESREPCSFVPVVVQVCPACAGQELALAHLPTSGRVWAAGLARTRRVW